jgi:hypothetical protein
MKVGSGRRWPGIASCCVTLAAFAAVPGVVGAQEGPATPGAGWTFTATPYVWFAGLKGDLGTISGLPPAEVDASFSDIIENTDVALMLAAEAGRDRWGLLLDLVYLNLSADADTPGPLFGGADLESETLFATLGVAYRVVEHDRLSADAVAGARLWYVETALELTAGLLPPRSADDDEFWADPVIGLRGRVDLGRGFFLASFADIGGFGLGSDLTWQIGSTLGYQVNDWLWVRAGYRHLHVDYEDDGFVFDVEMSGPILGVGFHF